MTWDLMWKMLVTSVVFSLVGLVVFFLGFQVLKVIFPFDIRKEIEHDHNVALGIVIAAFIIGLATIISSAIHG